MTTDLAAWAFVLGCALYFGIGMYVNAHQRRHGSLRRILPDRTDGISKCWCCGTVTPENEPHLRFDHCNDAVGR